MTADEREKARLRAQVRDLTATELDDELDPKRIRRTIDIENERRRAEGRPLLEENPEPPEAGLYARARALGLRRVGG